MDDEKEDYTQHVLVTYDATETEAERKKREKLGLPTPTYSFMCRHVEDEK